MSELRDDKAEEVSATEASSSGKQESCTKYFDKIWSCYCERCETVNLSCKSPGCMGYVGGISCEVHG